jgi:hypothetical protein
MQQHAPEQTAEHDSAPAGAERRAPVELELGDGSRLVLESAEASPIVCRLEGTHSECISLEDVMRLEGQPFAGFRLLR